MSEVVQATTERKRAGRRKLPDAREHLVAVRCNAGEYAAITARAVQCGLTVGAFLRAQALGTAGPRAIRRPPVEKEALVRLLGEIGKIGSNVNQIARQVNISGNLPIWAELAGINEEVRAMRAAVMKALGRGD